MKGGVIITQALSYEYVKDYIISFGYILLSPEYKNNHTKLEIICPENHTFDMRFNDFKKGYRCPCCFGNVKLTFDIIKKKFEEEGYILLSDKYVNAKSKLKTICPNDHEYYVSWDCFNRGIRCKECQNKLTGEKNKLTYEEVKNYIESFNYTFLSSEYINSKEKISIKCENGHVYEAPFSYFRSGNRCPYCFGNMKPPFDEVKSYIEKDKKYKLISTEYINATTPLEIKCSNHGVFFMPWYSFKYQGHRCKYCSRESLSGENHWNWQGGITSLNVYLRSLLDDWKKESLSKFNYQCFITGSTKNLEVHHLYSFSRIVKDILFELDLPVLSQINEYDKEDLIEIENKLLKFHKENLGIPLTSSVHKLFHNKYGMDVNPTHFNEFISKYKNEIIKLSEVV